MVLETVLKYFSSFAAVKIGKKRVQAIICSANFLPISTAAKDEKYFSDFHVSGGPPVHVTKLYSDNIDIYSVSLGEQYP